MLVVVVAVLAVHNVVGNLVVPSTLYVPVNLAVAAMLLVVGRHSGCSWSDLGLDRRGVGRGVAVGSALALGIAVVLAVAALVPATRSLFEDRRVAHVDGAGLAYRALIRIPLGTVILEELAFRGVLLPQLMRLRSASVAVAWSSMLFGLWHVIPTWEALHVNHLAEAPVARVLVVGAAVAATAVVGAAFCWLRLRAASVSAPMLVHAAANSLSSVASFVVWRVRS